jgi:hypothetical protein
MKTPGEATHNTHFYTRKETSQRNMQLKDKKIILVSSLLEAE